MKVVIIYATYSSGTLVSSEIIKEELQDSTHEVALINAGEVDLDSLSNFDLIILGSPSWWNNNTDGQPHHLFLELIKKMDGMSFEDKKFAIFGLGDSAYARLCGAVDVLEDFVEKLKGKLIQDSLRIDSFYFDQENNETLVKEWAKNLNI